MDFFSITLLAISLAMDACAVSISCGLSCRKNLLRTAFLVAFLFGLFQGLMPIFGFFIGNSFRVHFYFVAHWIAFGILLFIGIIMILECLQNKPQIINIDSLKILIVLALATSIDALACGVSLSLVNTKIWLPSFMIALITSFICFSGVILGRKLLFSNPSIQQKMQGMGGFILIIIAIKTLFEYNQL